MKLAGYLIALVVFVLDQASKFWIVDVFGLEAQETVRVLPFLSLTWVENRGVSLGMLVADTDTGRWLLVAMTAAIAGCVAFWIRRERYWPEIIALGLVLGGAIGNIVDRIRFGYVVDFIHLHAGGHSFYVFNVADAAITVGVAMLLFRALIGRSDNQTERLHDA